ncbi:hypothetical protein M404DRAFT_515123 [Pisolithus tinctorius Marx 270]|uniref:Uncharacterized protein n=1 Tax=Pisolithus tinctorius Marx 270 TaxID=870435 RepID=A0A0C3J6R4_PISTI|nr:hypothetical protein M404DRAFT_515123 [Pisolithus tinctorius Marx 270]
MPSTNRLFPTSNNFCTNVTPYLAFLGPNYGTFSVEIQNISHIESTMNFCGFRPWTFCQTFRGIRHADIDVRYGFALFPPHVVDGVYEGTIGNWICVESLMIRNFTFSSLALSK